jgi:hypothetical protein
MKTHNKTHFPFVAPKPQNMMPLEQVFCMVWLAQTCSFKELRAKQNLIEQQIRSAHQLRLDTANLLVIQDNIAAAIAYQSFPNHTLWVSFIKLS